MKPVVSSIVALAIAIAPFAAFADESSHKETTSKVSKHHHKKSHEENKDKKLQPVVHHAHNADVSGKGHAEPKDEKSEKKDAMVPASLNTKSHDKDKEKAHKASDKKSSDLPKLPDPKSEKPSKAAREKSHKSSEKKNDDGDNKDGQRERDEDFADLVARIRGHKSEPAREDDDSKSKHEKARRVSDRQPCAKDPVEIIRGPEIDRFALTKCDGTVAPFAVERLSIAIRPGSAARPVAPIAELAKKDGDEIAPRVHRVDPGLTLRMQALADHFGTPGTPVKISIVSGMRPTSVGSMHALGRAIDFRIEGQKNEDIVAFCKTLNDTGCGYYPNSSFVHLDVRDAGRGHVSWIDASGPGEKPRYVGKWPLKEEPLEPATAKEAIPDQDGMPEVEDQHP